MYLKLHILFRHPRPPHEVVRFHEFGIHVMEDWMDTRTGANQVRKIGSEDRSRTNCQGPLPILAPHHISYDRYDLRRKQFNDKIKYFYLNYFNGYRKYASARAFPLRLLTVFVVMPPACVTKYLTTTVCLSDNFFTGAHFSIRNFPVATFRKIAHGHA